MLYNFIFFSHQIFHLLQFLIETLHILHIVIFEFALQVVKGREVMLIFAYLLLQLSYSICQLMIVGDLLCQVFFKDLYLLFEIVYLVVKFFLLILKRFLDSLELLFIDGCSIDLVVMAVDVLPHLFEVVDELVNSIIALLQLFLQVSNKCVLAIDYFF